MAITNTKLLQLQAAASEILQKPENRDKNYGVFEKLWDNRQSLFPYMVTPEGEMTLDFEGNVASAQVALFQNTGDAIGTTRSTSHSGSALSTTTDTLTSSTVSQAFSVSMKDADDNFFKEPAQLAQGLLTARQKCLTKMNTDALAYLEANKTGVSLVSTYGLNDVTFDGVNDVHNVANASKDLFFAIAMSIMGVNNYGNFNIDMIHDYNLKTLAADFFNQGTNNDVNKQYQISDRFNYAPALIDPGTAYGIGYMFPQGSVAIATSIPKANRRGAQGDSQIWSSFADPVYPGLNWALHTIETAEDGNIAQDLSKSFELSVDYAFKASPISTADEEVIHKIALLKT